MQSTILFPHKTGCRVVVLTSHGCFQCFLFFLFPKIKHYCLYKYYGKQLVSNNNASQSVQCLDEDKLIFTRSLRPLWLNFMRREFTSVLLICANSTGKLEARNVPYLEGIFYFYSISSILVAFDHTQTLLRNEQMAPH